MSGMIRGRQRWICPVCFRPAGRSNGDGLSRHGVPKCPGTGSEVAVLDEWVEPGTPPTGRTPPAPEPLAVVWVPPPIPADPAPFRRWRGFGWTSEQIAAVTGEGALW